MSDEKPQSSVAPSGDQRPISPPFATIRVIDQTGRTIRFAIKWGVIAFCGYEASEAVQAFAGQETGLKLAITAWVETKVGITVGSALTIGALGIGYGNWQARLRRRAIERMGRRPAELEAMIDPKRSSSGLLQDGRTPLIDREP